MLSNLFLSTDFSQKNWQSIASLAAQFRNEGISPSSNLKNKKVGILFFEPSSRTKWSFEKACLDLNLPYMSSQVDGTSSKSKGEIDADTLQLYIELGFDLIVMRSAEDISLQRVVQQNPQQKFINAGFGSLAHPTQAFLDYFTWTYDCGLKPQDTKLLILGDLKHSRVARSHIRLSKHLGYGLGLLASKGLEMTQSELEDYSHVKIFEDRNEALNWSNLVMPLRVQKERHDKDQSLTIDFPPLSYKDLRLDHHIMHPGPFMRGSDLESDLVSDKRSLIFKQKRNGVFCRAAILNMMLLGG